MLTVYRNNILATEISLNLQVDKALVIYWLTLFSLRKFVLSAKSLLFKWRRNERHKERQLDFQETSSEAHITKNDSLAFGF